MKYKENTGRRVHPEDVNVVRNSKDETGVCIEMTLRRDCSRNLSTLLWAVFSKQSFDYICIKRKNS